MREVLGTVGCVLLAVFAVIVLTVGAWGAKVFFAEYIGRGNAHIQIQSAESRITRYEEFFSLCVSVQNAEVALDAETARLKETTDERTRAEIQTNISALTTTRANGINTYNANALKDYTDGQFLASNLPYQLATTPYEPEGVKTTCAT